MPIDGLVSGLDTNAIVTKLMDLERVPRDQMATRRDDATSALEALKSIDVKLGAVSLASNALSRATGWMARTSTSSNESVATAAATLGAGASRLSFTVDALARAHGLVTATGVAAASDVVASGGIITFHQGGEDHQLAVGAGTLDEVVAAVNASGLGIRAAAVDTGSGIRLQLDANSTGVASTFTVDGLDAALGGTVVTTQATDAKITLGAGPGAYSVTSSTNAFTNLTPGVSVTVKALSAVPVEIAVAADSGAIADRVGALVDAVNSALDEIAAQTAYDADSKTAGVLNGDPGARRVAQSLVRAVTDAVVQSPLGAPGLAGVSVDRTGKITFDRDKFLAAYAKDPAAVQRLFVQDATASSADLRFAGASDRTRAGTVAVEVTALPVAATMSSPALDWPAVTATTVALRRSGVTVSYQVQPGDTATDAMSGLQAALDAAGMQVDVSTSGGLLSVTSREVGSAGSFDVAWDGTTFYAAQGTDIAGTIDGLPATGQGRTLTASAAESISKGLAVTYQGTTLGPVGTVSYDPGLAQRLITAVGDARDPSGGALTSSQTTRQGRIDLLTRSIDAYDRRLVAREAQLRSQYAALEVALGKLQSTGSWLSNQIGSMSSSSSKS
jgi:flagellar hook-associated protein 2